MSVIAFIDLEVSATTKKIGDVGCLLSSGAKLHSNKPQELKPFVSQADFICGHNIIAHDLAYLQKFYGDANWGLDRAIDTLLLSPLLFPKRPYHNLLKDDKLQTEELNNPLNDASKAKDLFFDEINAFHKLTYEQKTILYNLLHDKKGYANFFKYLSFSNPLETTEVEALIRSQFAGLFCENAPIQKAISQEPIALSYTLALIQSNDRYSITPPWVLMQIPAVQNLINAFRNTPCPEACSYCTTALNPLTSLEKYFGYKAFRKFDNEPMQENAVRAAIEGKSLLAVFPTGGGKSITFQVPALMSGENAKALTVVISPLQSLMKDQVDNLEKKGITEAVTINGLLDPIERSKSIERVENGTACLLYISPESLRSITIERLLLKRTIARFVIDEAHCFSSWGQDFRVDYLYIGDFIKSLQEKKNADSQIPVSCFTATAKQKVIEDIKEYFKSKLNLTLELFRSDASRTNLHYNVVKIENEDEKYEQLRDIIEKKNCPTIIYVSRTKKAFQLSKRLTDDGFDARPYHGKMDKEEKSENQNAFMKGEIKIMVATSAFGMGVDKSDVGAVIHYDISDSLENYVQEAGRAGRDEHINADCYVLFNKEDLDKHFILLNQTKISVKEINQIWRAIKDLTKTRERASNSALEIARKAGWDEGITEIETRVKTAIAALEDSGFVKRGQNMPRVLANSILCKNAQEAIDKINNSPSFTNDLKEKAIRIIKKLFSGKSKRLTTEEDAETRIDYISDQLGVLNEEVIRIIQLLKLEKILADTKDLTAFIKGSETANRSLAILENYRKQEEKLLTLLQEEEAKYHLKSIIEEFINSGQKDSSINKLKTILNFWSIKKWIKRQNLEYTNNHVAITLLLKKKDFEEKVAKRNQLAKIIIEYLFTKAFTQSEEPSKSEEKLIEFSIQELLEAVKIAGGIFTIEATIDDIEDTLFYLSRIEAIKIEGGFLVAYNRITVDRLEKNTKIQYKTSNYEKLKHHYDQKIQQIHIVGEYARKMISNYNDALKFADDYFKLNYASFLRKYFPGSRQDEITKTITPEKFQKLFASLSPAQLDIIRANHPHIVVAAGPGSGKTRVLVHKLASLILTEDTKHEQLLMLTFSRAAATEFKKRLLDLIGNAANYVEIKTFHSYCFDLLGLIGNLAVSEQIVSTAVAKIRSGEIEPFRITKSVLVIDEAQDMNHNEFELVKALMEQNEGMRVILVGDDDQNIYGFRGADSRHMQSLLLESDAVKYELTENYRSTREIVEFSNLWATNIANRLKSTPCYSKKNDNGEVNIIEYKNQKLPVPLAEYIQKLPLTGSTCILTRKNDEAVILLGLLLKNGIKAKLIQSKDGFNLNNLYEINYFTSILKKQTDSPLISNEDWENAKKEMGTHITANPSKKLAELIIKDFEEAYPVKKYMSDWQNFLFESEIESFLKTDTETIYISTIHKAKGKEFDNILLLWENAIPSTDEEKRAFYVGITRAKSKLSIHYNRNFLQPFTDLGITYSIDNNTYPEPSQLALFLTHRDVQLGYFAYVQNRMQNLLSGSSLTILEDGLGNSRNELVLKYSKSFKEKLNEYSQRGYSLKEAKVNFIVYWKNEDAEKEVKIILPQLLLHIK